MPLLLLLLMLQGVGLLLLLLLLWGGEARGGNKTRGGCKRGE